MLYQFSAFTKTAAYGLAAVLVSCGSAAAAGYQVVRPADGFASIASVELNNSGAVVFVGKKGAFPGELSGIYKGGSGGFATLHEVMSFEAPPGEEVIVPLGVAINAANEVLAYGGVLGTSFSRLGVGSGSINWFSGANSLAASPFGFDYNDRKLILWGRFVFGGEAQEQQARSCDNCSGIELNNRNQMLTYFPVGGMYRFARIDLGLIVPDPRFPESKRWAPVRTNVIVTLARPRPATMNENGEVAFYDAKPDGTVGIYKSTGGAITTVAESRSGDSQFEFHTFQGFAINNRGEVAFTASSRTLKTSGVFRGPNPLLHRIVAAGDLLDGVPIPAKLPGLISNEGPTAGRWFNDNGQIVVGGGNDLWVVSDVPRGPGLPPPEPESAVFRYVATVTSPGDYGIVQSWERVSPQPPIPDPPRVPETTTNHADTALFDQSGQYTVTVGASRHNHRFILRHGELILTDGAYKVDAVSFDEPSALIDAARLSLLTAFALTNNHAWIGPSADSQVDVGFGGDWVTLGSLRVGGVGEGILNVNPGGNVVSAESRIGTGAGGGKATVGNDATWTTGNLAIGMGGAGELTVTGNGQVTSELAVIGQEPGPDSFVAIEGSTPNGSATWNTLVTKVGAKSGGNLTILDGAEVSAVSFQIATEAGVGAATIVQGVGSSGSSSYLLATTLDVGESAPGYLDVLDGGWVEADQEAHVGRSLGSYGRILVSGVHAASGERSMLQVGSSGLSDSLNLGGEGIGLLVIDDGGSVEVSGDCFIGAPPVSGADTEIEVRGGTQLLIDGDLYLVGSGHAGRAVVTITNGFVKARSLWLTDSNTVIQGVGTLAVASDARVNNNGGFISPGLSPGVLTIEGSYGQGSEGRLLIEIGGTNSAAYDQLVVTNEATLDGQVTFKFINGFAPKAGEQFKFLSVGGTRHGAFAKVGMQNLAPGFQFDVAPSGSTLSMTARNDGVYDTSLPGRVEVTITNGGGINYATYTISTSNTCHAIELDGALVRTNNTFHQGFQGTRLVQAGCTAAETTRAGTLVLGTLAPGEYSFAITVDGQVTQTIAFTVAAGQGQTLLNPTRLPNGAVQFEINGPPPIPYRIDVSTDLETWSPLTRGQLPAIFTDFDATIFPTRFYRAVIGP